MSEVTLTLPRLHNKQQTIINQASRFNALNCGRRFGKNVLLHDRAIMDLLAGKPVGWGSPTYKNLEEDWRAIYNYVQPIIRDKDEGDHRLELVTGGVFEMWTLTDPDNIRSRHYASFYINEAAYVKDLVRVWNKVISPLLIDLRGTGWLASTPKGMGDWHTVYSWGLGGMPDWKSWTFSSYENPHIPHDEIDRLREQMTEQEFRQEIMAEFVQNEGAVFRNLEAALTAPEHQRAGDHLEHTFVAGVDWGQSNDFTVISVGCVDCAREVYIDRFNQIDYYFQRQRIGAVNEAWKPRRILAELNSIGQPNFEMLQRDGLPVSGFTTTQTSKSALIEGFSLALETNKVKLLPDEVGRAELQAYERSVTANGLSRYSAPDGLHDDTVIARALMYRAMSETSPGINVRIQRVAQDYQPLRSIFG